MAALRSLTDDDRRIARDDRVLAVILHALTAPFLVGVIYCLVTGAWFAAVCWAVLAAVTLGLARSVSRSASA